MYLTIQPVDLPQGIIDQRVHHHRRWTSLPASGPMPCSWRPWWARS